MDFDAIFGFFRDLASFLGDEAFLSRGGSEAAAGRLWEPPLPADSVTPTVGVWTDQNRETQSGVDLSPGEES